MNEVLTDWESRKYNRIKYGNEMNDCCLGEPCEVCGVGEGQYHLESCVNERCPKCGRLLVSCSCLFWEQNKRLFLTHNDLMAS